MRDPHADLSGGHAATVRGGRRRGVTSALYPLTGSARRPSWEARRPGSPARRRAGDCRCRVPRRSKIPSSTRDGRPRARRYVGPTPRAGRTPVPGSFARASARGWHENYDLPCRAERRRSNPPVCLASRGEPARVLPSRRQGDELEPLQAPRRPAAGQIVVPELPFIVSAPAVRLPGACEPARAAVPSHELDEREPGGDPDRLVARALGARRHGRVVTTAPAVRLVVQRERAEVPEARPEQPEPVSARHGRGLGTVAPATPPADPGGAPTVRRALREAAIPARSPAPGVPAGVEPAGVPQSDRQAPERVAPDDRQGRCKLRQKKELPVPALPQLSAEVRAPALRPAVLGERARVARPGRDGPVPGPDKVPEA